MNKPTTDLTDIQRRMAERRWRDALRLLPIVGLLFFLFPVLWSNGSDNNALTSSGGTYIFVAWGVLILVSAWVAKRAAKAAQWGEDSNPSPENFENVDG